MSLPDEKIIIPSGNGLDDQDVLSNVCPSDGCEIPLFNEINLRSDTEWSSGGESSKILNNSNFNSTDPANRGDWNQQETHFNTNPIDLQIIGNSNSDEFLTQPIDYLTTPSSESTQFDHYHQIHSSPNYHLSGSDSILPFEELGNFHSSSSHLDFLSQVHSNHDIPPYVPTIPHDISNPSLHPDVSHLNLLAIPNQNLDYIPSSTNPPLLSFKKSIPLISNHNSISQNLTELNPPFHAFDGIIGIKSNHEILSLPKSHSRYTPNIDDFMEPTATESSSLQKPSWDIQTHSSSSRASSYDQSNTEPMRYPAETNASNYFSSSTPNLIPSLSSSNLFNPKIHPRGGSLEPERRKQDSSKPSASRDHPHNQRRIGSLIGIHHHLTNHVPRRRLTVEQEQILLRRFAVQEYLTKHEMEELAEKLKIPTSQLRTWFGNRRSKLKAAARQKAKIEAGMGHLTDAELRNLNRRN